MLLERSKSKSTGERCNCVEVLVVESTIMARGHE